LHHISHNIVTIHLTLANSQGEVCDEAEAIYYTFGPEKAQESVSQILFVLLQCHSELCFIFTAR